MTESSLAPNGDPVDEILAEVMRQNSIVEDFLQINLSDTELMMILARAREHVLQDPELRTAREIRFPFADPEAGSSTVLLSKNLVLVLAECYHGVRNAIAEKWAREHPDKEPLFHASELPSAQDIVDLLPTEREITRSDSPRVQEYLKVAGQLDQEGFVGDILHAHEPKSDVLQGSMHIDVPALEAGQAILDGVHQRLSRIFCTPPVHIARSMKEWRAEGEADDSLSVSESAPRVIVSSSVSQTAQREPAPMFGYFSQIEDRLERGDYSLSLIGGIANRTRELLAEEFEDPTGHPLDRTLNRLRKELRLEPRRWGRKTSGKSLLEARSVLDFTDASIKGNIGVSEYTCAFVEAAATSYRQMQTSGVMKALVAGAHPINTLSLPGAPETTSYGEIGANHQFLATNSSLNYLSLIGAREAVPYNDLHQREMYLFTNANSPTQFAMQVANYRNGIEGQVNLVHGKDLLELGAGNGADIHHFLQNEAKSVTVVDGSPFMLKRLHIKFHDQGGRVKLLNGDEGMDMFDALDDCKERGEKFDTICGHSSVHYFDDPRFLELLSRIHACLKPEGHFAFAVKAPGAVLDGHGIPLFNDSTTLQTTERKKEVRGDFVRGRMWMNVDGQARIFRSEGAWCDLLASHFDVLDRSVRQVQNYEASGQMQEFYNFICRRKEVVSV